MSSLLNIYISARNEMKKKRARTIMEVIEAKAQYILYIYTIIHNNTMGGKT